MFAVCQQSSVAIPSLWYGMTLLPIAPNSAKLAQMPPETAYVRPDAYLTPNALTFVQLGRHPESRPFCSVFLGSSNSIGVFHPFQLVSLIYDIYKREEACEN